MMEPGQDELDEVIQELFERLDKQEEENATYVRFLKTENAMLEEQYQALKKTSLKKSNWTSRIAVAAVVMSFFVCLTAFLIPSVEKEDAEIPLKSAIESDEESNMYAQITPASADTIIETPEVKPTEPEMNEPAEHPSEKLEELQPEETEGWEPFYKQTLAKLKLERLNPNAPVSSDVKQQLSELEKARKQLFKEKDYTFDEWYFKGIAEKEKNDCRKAISSLTEALKLNPKSAGAYSYRGYCYSRLKQHPSAIADYTTAIKLNPRVAESYYNRGGSYYYLKQYEPAIADYTSALNIGPKDAATYCNRGTCYFIRKDYENAIDDYTRAIELDPDDADSYYNRGVVYNAIYQTTKAQSDMAKAKALNPRIY